MNMDLYDFLLGQDVCFAWIQFLPMGLSLFSGIGSGINSAIQNKKQEKVLAEDKAKKDAWFNKEYYTPMMERTENAAVLGALNDQMKEQAQRNAKTAVITGATPESVLAAQEAANKNYADTVRGLAAGESARKSNLLNAKMGIDSDYTQAQLGISAAKTQNWQNIAQNATSFASSAMNALGNRDLYNNLPDFLKFKSR